MSDLVRDYLRNKGCAKHVVEGGLEGLTKDWEETAASVVQGYPLGLDDYLNDMDGRQLLEEVLAISGVATKAKYKRRVRRADDEIRKVLAPTRHCIWGDGAASEHGWSPEENWWYFSEPKSACPELLEDLKRSAR